MKSIKNELGLIIVFIAIITLLMVSCDKKTSEIEESSEPKEDTIYTELDEQFALDDKNNLYFLSVNKDNLEPKIILENVKSMSHRAISSKDNTSFMLENQDIYSIVGYEKDKTPILKKTIENINHNMVSMVDDRLFLDSENNLYYANILSGEFNKDNPDIYTNNDFEFIKLSDDVVKAINIEDTLVVLMTSRGDLYLYKDINQEERIFNSEDENTYFLDSGVIDFDVDGYIGFRDSNIKNDFNYEIGYLQSENKTVNKLSVNGILSSYSIDEEQEELVINKQKLIGGTGNAINIYCRGSISNPSTRYHYYENVLFTDEDNVECYNKNNHKSSYQNIHVTPIDPTLEDGDVSQSEHAVSFTTFYTYEGTKNGECQFNVVSISRDGKILYNYVPIRTSFHSGDEKGVTDISINQMKQDGKTYAISVSPFDKNAMTKEEEYPTPVRFDPSQPAVDQPPDPDTLFFYDENVKMIMNYEHIAEYSEPDELVKCIAIENDGSLYRLEFIRQRDKYPIDYKTQVKKTLLSNNVSDITNIYYKDGNYLLLKTDGKLHLVSIDLEKATLKELEMVAANVKQVQYNNSSAAPHPYIHYLTNDNKLYYINCEHLSNGIIESELLYENVEIYHTENKDANDGSIIYKTTNGKIIYEGFNMEYIEVSTFQDQNIKKIYQYYERDIPSINYDEISEKMEMGRGISDYHVVVLLAITEDGELLFEILE